MYLDKKTRIDILHTWATMCTHLVGQLCAVDNLIWQMFQIKQKKKIKLFYVLNQVKLN